MLGVRYAGVHYNMLPNFLYFNIFSNVWRKTTHKAVISSFADPRCPETKSGATGQCESAYLNVDGEESEVRKRRNLLRISCH